MMKPSQPNYCTNCGEPLRQSKYTSSTSSSTCCLRCSPSTSSNKSTSAILSSRPPAYPPPTPSKTVQAQTLASLPFLPSGQHVSSSSSVMTRQRSRSPESSSSRMFKGKYSTIGSSVSKRKEQWEKIESFNETPPPANKPIKVYPAWKTLLGGGNLVDKRVNAVEKNIAKSHRAKPGGSSPPCVGGTGGTSTSIRDFGGHLPAARSAEALQAQGRDPEIFGSSPRPGHPLPINGPHSTASTSSATQPTSISRRNSNENSSSGSSSSGSGMSGSGSGISHSLVYPHYHPHYNSLEGTANGGGHASSGAASVGTTSSTWMPQPAQWSRKGSSTEAKKAKGAKGLPLEELFKSKNSDHNINNSNKNSFNRQLPGEDKEKDKDDKKSPKGDPQQLQQQQQPENKNQQNESNTQNQNQTTQEMKKAKKERKAAEAFQVRHKMKLGIRAALDLSRQRYPPNLKSKRFAIARTAGHQQQVQQSPSQSQSPPNAFYVELSEEDCRVKNTFSLKSAEDSYVFREYAPVVFRALRTMFGISDEDYVESMCGDEDFANLGFSGKSGSFLYITADNQYVIKTISSLESKFLRKILPLYYEHLSMGPSFLTKFLGLYRMKLSPIDKISFLVMKNIFSTTKKIHERYDLKGSTVGRKTLFSCTLDRPISGLMLKDLDLVDRFRIKLGRERKLAFMQSLKTDAEFLEHLEIIDYSLLLGVHFVDSTEEEVPFGPLSAECLEMADGGIYASNDARQPLKAIYYCAIIDILQAYTTKKQLEHNLKAFVYDKDGISVCPPTKYVSRFLQFIGTYID